MNRNIEVKVHKFRMNKENKDICYFSFGKFSYTLFETISI